MRLAGLLLILVGIAVMAMGLADLAHVGQNLPMAGAGIASLVSGIAIVIFASRTKEFRGFDEKIEPGQVPGLTKEEVDHG